MGRAFDTLLTRMQELRDLGGIGGLLTWDQETYMPRAADDARGSQLSALQGLYHERLVDPEVGDLIGDASVESDLTDDHRAMIRELKWERDRAIRVPESLVRELAQAQTRGVVAWRAARVEKRFETFRPALERLLTLRRQQADALGHDGERYDALLENFEPGMRVARLTPVLAELERKLVPIANALCDRPPPPDLLSGDFEEEKQWRWLEQLLREMGFDLSAGRLDKSIHPFTGGTHARDVRLTIRLDPKNVRPALFSVIHEGGHGLYEQGFLEAHYRTPLSAAPSMGLHESQSRLWENMVGRGRAFWRHYLPSLQAEFPALAHVTLDAIYASANRVERSLVRTEADEVTYNLHIVLRYQLELALLRGDLPIADLAEEWKRRSEKILGQRPADDLQGVLQDIHWASGEFGYFPTYTLGNLYAASTYRAMQRELPDLEQAIGEGRLTVVRDWLKKRIHAEGHRYSAEELIRRVTGEGLTDVPFIDYLKTKYSEIYGIRL